MSHNPQYPHNQPGQHPPPPGQYPGHPPQQPYGGAHQGYPGHQPNPYGPPVDPEGGGIAVATFILALVGIFVIITSPVAWVTGHIGRKNAQRRGFKPHGLLTAGWIMGIIFTILWFLYFLFIFVVFGAILAADPDMFTPPQ